MVGHNASWVPALRFRRCVRGELTHSRAARSEDSKLRMKDSGPKVFAALRPESTPEGHALRMGSARVVAAGAVLGALATLLGAALGVGATLFVSDRQQDAAVAAEVRERRSAVYATYAQATYRYMAAQRAFAEEGMKHCAVRVSLEKSNKQKKPACLGYQSTPELEGARIAWIDARQDVGIYGSASANRAAKRWGEAISPSALPYYPTSEVAEDMAKDRGKAFTQYEEAETAFLRVMCAELPAAGDQCEQSGLVGG